MSILNFLGKICSHQVEGSIQRIAQHIARNVKNAPIHCDEPMEYIGEHSGDYSNTQFYQCKKCKQLTATHKHDWEK